MKFVLKYFVLLSVLFAYTNVANAAYCPEVYEFSQQTMALQQKGMQMYKDSKTKGGETDVDPMDLVRDTDKYLNSVVNDCITYFKTEPNPDCSKFHSFSTAYILLSMTNKAQADKVISSLGDMKNKCSAEFAGLEAVQSQFGNRQLQY